MNENEPLYDHNMVTFSYEAKLSDFLKYHAQQAAILANLRGTKTTEKPPEQPEEKRRFEV